MTRVLIIGGGLAGLAAAQALAPRGFRVTLLEARNRLGGRARSFSDGPTGQLIVPYGLLTHEVCVAAYAEQAGALADGGVDLLVLETFFALEEALWAFEGASSVTDLPIVVSFSFDQGTRTMMGIAPADVVGAFAPLGVAAIGANCGRSNARPIRMD